MSKLWNLSIKANKYNFKVIIQRMNFKFYLIFKYQRNINNQ